MIVLGVASGQNGLPDKRTFHGSVVAIDAITGAEVWRVQTSGTAWSSSRRASRAAAPRVASSDRPR